MQIHGLFILNYKYQFLLYHNMFIFTKCSHLQGEILCNKLRDDIATPTEAKHLSVF